MTSLSKYHGLGNDFLVLVDLGEEEGTPRYWIIPTLVANELISSEQIKTRDVEAYENRWDLLG